jgi:biopolymer transport protein ExbD
MRKRRTRSPATLTDIAFLLLLFFLILAVETPNYPLPEAQQPHDITHQDLPTLEVKGTTVLLGSNPIEIKDIAYQDHYILKTSKETPYGIIHPIINHLTEMGVVTLSLLVQENT